MSAPDRSVLSQQLDLAVTACKDGWQILRRRGPSQVQFWFIALAIGIAAGFAALFFRKGIEALQAFLYGTEDVQYLHSFASSLPWYLILIIPIIGGLITGLILHNFTKDAVARSVADVIEGAALRDGRVGTRAGVASAFASFITLSTGGSTGREGPVVHIAAVISTKVCRWIKADGVTGRDLLGCAVAAAVSASFNAPIAGALFALEVVLRHFAVHAFAPIVIASVAGTVINRLEFGGVTEFMLPDANELAFYQELPAFLLLGLTCGLVSVILMRSIFWTDDIASRFQRATGMPRWLRPAVAGAMLGGYGDFLSPYHWGWVRNHLTCADRATGVERGDGFHRDEDSRRCRHDGRTNGRWSILPVSDDRSFDRFELWLDRNRDFSGCFRVSHAVRTRRHGRCGRSRFGCADFDDAHCVRVDGGLANGPCRDGGCVNVYGAVVAAGGPIFLPHSA